MAYRVNPGDLFITTHVRLGNADRMWAILLWLGQRVGGRSYYMAVSPGSTVYKTTHSPFINSGEAGTINKIGHLQIPQDAAPDDVFKSIDDILRTIDHATPAEFGGRRVKFTPRVWVLVAVKKLHEAGIINAPNPMALIQECDANDAETSVNGPSMIWYTCSNLQ
ncbi:hypothetical protein K474DRAFT_1669704 [Panus rudis PR-1116 ss-1]|nr:hypothetical protein K474DRAFT_1669704 [Panus rudis PR-1116 ss-1]